MPIYQYDCDGCDQRVDVFFRSANSTSDAVCPECGGKKLTRVMSAFARARSSAERLDSIDFDQEMGRLKSGDQGDFARWAKRIGKDFDGEMGSDFSEIADRASSGEDPIDRVDPGFKLKYELNKNKGKSDDHGHGHDH